MSTFRDELKDAAASAEAEVAMRHARELEHDKAEYERLHGEADRRTIAEVETAEELQGHKDRAKDIASVRRKLRGSAEGHLRTAGGLVRGREDKRLSDTDFQAFRRAADALKAESDLDGTLGELEQRERRAASAKVTKEPRVYSATSEHSWYLDVAHAGSQEFADHGAQEARERLARYGAELSYEVRKRVTPEARYIARCVSERTRIADRDAHKRSAENELRALTTGGGATAAATSGGSSFVSPFFLNDAWAPFRGAHRTFADQLDSQPCPEYGLELYIPTITSASSVSQQTEGLAVSESSPTAAFQSAELKTVSGQVIISQQLHDRGFTGGGSYDVVIQRQLQQQLDEQVDKLALNTAISNGEAVSGASSFSFEEFYADLAKGREKLSDTAGTRLRPTHLFTTSDLYSYVTRQVNATTHAPVIEPRFIPGFPLAKNVDVDSGPAPAWANFTGTVLPGGVLWFTDENVPAVGTTTKTQLIVSAPEIAIVLVESAPLLTVSPQTLAEDLEVVVNLRSYVAAITRHAAGTAVITGSAYTTALV